MDKTETQSQTDLKNGQKPVVIQEPVDQRVVDGNWLSQTVNLIQTVDHLVYGGCIHAYQHTRVYQFNGPVFSCTNLIASHCPGVNGTDFYRPDAFLLPSQQRQSTEGNSEQEKSSTGLVRSWLTNWLPKQGVLSPRWHFNASSESSSATVSYPNSIPWATTDINFIATIIITIPVLQLISCDMNIHVYRNFSGMKQYFIR